MPFKLNSLEESQTSYECIDRMHLNYFVLILRLPGYLVPATACTSCIL